MLYLFRQRGAFHFVVRYLFSGLGLWGAVHFVVHLLGLVHLHFHAKLRAGCHA